MESTGTREGDPTGVEGRLKTGEPCHPKSGRLGFTLSLFAAFALIVSMASCGSARHGEAMGANPRVERGGAATADPELSGRLQALLDDLVSSQGTIRNGLLLVEGPDFKWKGASGVAFAEGEVPMLPDDQFNIDSVAKMMTATIVMKLVEDGKLRLEDRIARYLPASLMEGLHVHEGRSYGEEITVRQLLNHTSGIPDDWAHPDFVEMIIADPNRRWTPEETVEFVKKNCTPESRPGEVFEYSDVGYNLLGLIIENVTDSPLHEAYRDLLLDPLGMDDTYRPSHEEARPGIPGRKPSERWFGDVECTQWPAIMTADWAGGGLLSTTEDLNRFLRAFAHNEIFDDPATRDSMLAWVDSGPFHNYGFGISRVDFDRSDSPLHAGLGEIWGHRGTSNCFMFYWPARDVTFAGTLNQIDCEKDGYDILASIMHAIQGES